MEKRIPPTGERSRSQLVRTGRPRAITAASMNPPATRLARTGAGNTPHTAPWTSRPARPALRAAQRLPKSPMNSASQRPLSACLAVSVRALLSARFRPRLWPSVVGEEASTSIMNPRTATTSRRKGTRKMKSR